MVKDAVKVLVDVVEHVDHFHGRAVVAECGEAHDVTEVDGDLLKQLWLHFARLLQGAHHRAEGRGTCDSYLSCSNRVHFKEDTRTFYIQLRNSPSGLAVSVWNIPRTLT